MAPHLCVYDLGASGGTPPPFCWVEDGLTLVNFDPDSRAVLAEGKRNYSVAIGPKGMNTLHVNHRQTTSSLLPPCRDIVDRYDFSAFPEGQDIFKTIDTVEVETVGLDEAILKYEIPSPNFIKLDVQGLTYEVLQTGEKLLENSVLGIQAEVEFLETYKGQKSFSAVHDLLAEYDFEVFKLTNLCSWKYKTSYPLVRPKGQDVYCDLLYLRSLRHVDRYPEFWSFDRITHFIQICLLHDLTDTAAAFLDKFVKNGMVKVSSITELSNLVSSWDQAVDYFYLPKEGVAKNQGRKAQFITSCDLMLKSLLPKAIYGAIRDFKKSLDSEKPQ